MAHAGRERVQGTDEAAAPARWLLQAGVDGVPLTQTHALARTVVREAAERWPSWWHAELFGAPHREADLAVLTALREGLLRLKLVRRRGRRLYATPRGRELASDPAALLTVLIADLGAGDLFTQAVAAAVTGVLAGGDQRSRDDLTAAALSAVRRGGWRDPDDQPPSEREVSWAVSEVLCRGEAYGVFQRCPDPSESRFRTHQLALSPAARAMLRTDRPESVGSRVFVFDAELLHARGVRARLAVGADQHLTALHDAIQEAFGWSDDHLYSFWLDGSFWSDKRFEITTPHDPDEGVPTADVPISELDLAIGARIAYVFDFGDEWRVLLTVREHVQPDGGAYPRVVSRSGEAPPQYPGPAED